MVDWKWIVGALVAGALGVVAWFKRPKPAAPVLPAAPTPIAITVSESELQLKLAALTRAQQQFGAEHEAAKVAQEAVDRARSALETMYKEHELTPEEMADRIRKLSGG